jgi:hypothetical protein
MARTRTPIPRELVEGRKRIDAWRRRRATRAMPEPLWSLATRLGARHGVSATARALGVRFDTLRARVAASGGRAEAPAATFVELRASPGAPACRVEMEDGQGGRMRIDLGAEVLPALEALGRLFLGRRG